MGPRNRRRQRDLRLLHRDGRNRHRRARCRNLQGPQLPAGEEDGDRVHQRHQARVRSQEHPEPRKGVPVEGQPSPAPQVSLQGIHVKPDGGHPPSTSFFYPFHP